MLAFKKILMEIFDFLLIFVGCAWDGVLGFFCLFIYFKPVEVINIFTSAQSMLVRNISKVKKVRAKVLQWL